MPGLSCSVSPGTVAIQLSLPLCRPYLLCLSRHGSHSALSQSVAGAAASWMLSGSPPSLFLWQIPCGQQEQSPEFAQCHDEEKEGSKSEYLIASSYPISTFPLPKLQRWSPSSVLQKGAAFHLRQRPPHPLPCLLYAEKSLIIWRSASEWFVSLATMASLTLSKALLTFMLLVSD